MVYLISAHLNHVLAAHSPASTHSACALCLTLDLVCLAILLLLCGSLLATDDDQDVAQRLLPGFDAGSNLAPLLLSKDAVGGAVNKENLLLLGKLALDESCANNVDDPHLNVRLWNLQSLGDAAVWDLAIWSGGSEGGQGNEAHLAVEDGGVEAIVGNEGVVLITEVVVILELLLGEDIKEVGPDWLGFGQSLDSWEGVKVVEVEVGGGEESSLQGAKSEGGGLWGGEGSGISGIVGAQSTEKVLV